MSRALVPRMARHAVRVLVRAGLALALGSSASSAASLCAPEKLGLDPGAIRGRKSVVLRHLQAGMRALVAGNAAQAIADLEQADRLVQELRPTSVTEAVASLVVNDRSKAYIGEIYEQAYIKYYLAIGYMLLGDYEEAAVEARRLNAVLEANDRVLRTQAKLRNRYRMDAAPRIVAGMLHELTGDVEDAFIDYEQAAREYAGEYGEITGVPFPALLWESLRDLAPKVGRVGSLEQLEALWVRSRSEAAAGGEGEYLMAERPLFADNDALGSDPLEVLFADSGSVSEASAGKGAAGRGARSVRRGLLFVILEFGRSPVRVEDAVLVPVPGELIPARLKGEFSPGTVVPIVTTALADRPARIVSATVSVGERPPTRLATVSDIGAIAKACLDDRRSALRTKSLFRSVGKQIVAQLIERHVSRRSGVLEGVLAGLIAKGVAATTERADTRSWQALPRRIAMGRWNLEAGAPHVVSVSYTDGDGTVVAEEKFDVTVPASGGVVVWRRTCE